MSADPQEERVITAEEVESARQVEMARRAQRPAPIITGAVKRRVHIPTAAEKRVDATLRRMYGEQVEEKPGV